MGWATEMKVLLIVLVFSKWPLTTETLHQESSLAGMPLSEAEYESFFQTLAARHVLHAVCFRRAVYGCFDPAIQALDRYENHGIIPTGWICSDFPDNSSFSGFCDFALYRCSMKKYFAKRVLCPDEITQMSTVVENNPEGIPDEIVIPTTEQSFELYAGTPTTGTESLPESLASSATAATEISTTPLPTTTVKAPLAKLLSSSAVETASKLVSQILAAFKAAKKPSSVPAPSVLELTPTSPATATPEASSATAMTEEFLNELTSTATIIMEPEIHPATMATIATPKQATAIALTESFPQHAVAMEPELHPAKMATVAAPTQATAIALTESFPEHGIIMEPELHPANMATIAAPTQATAIALTESFPEHGIIMEPELHPAKMATVATPTQATAIALTESFPEHGIIMEPELHPAKMVTTAELAQATITASTESFPGLAIVMEPEIHLATITAPTQATTIALTESFPEHAIIMEPELHPAKTATIAAPTQATIIAHSESFPEHAIIMEPELHPAKTATIAAPTQATIIAHSESFPEHAIIMEPELHPAKTATFAAPTQATTIAPTESFPEHAIIMEPEFHPAKTATFAAPTQATTMALTKSFSELATAMELFPESPSGTTTHTTTTITPIDTETCVVDYPEPLGTATDSTSSTGAAAPSSTSLLPIHTAITPTKATISATSSTTTTLPWPFVPSFNVPLSFPPLQSNSTLRILILSFFRNKNVKDGGMAGINGLAQAALGSGNIVQQEEIQNPLPTNGLKDLLFRLQDKGVQQLMHKMQNGISGEEQKPQLLSSALHLLRALNPRSDFKSKLQR